MRYFFTLKRECFTRQFCLNNGLFHFQLRSNSMWRSCLSVCMYVCLHFLKKASFTQDNQGGVKGHQRESLRTKRSQEESRGVKRNQEESRGVQWSKEESIEVKRCQEELGRVKRSKDELREAKKSQEGLRGVKRSQEESWVQEDSKRM